MAEKPGPSVGTGSSDAQTPFRCEDGPFTRLPTQREPETVPARVAATSPGRPAREDGPHSAHTRAHTVRACSHTSTRASMCTGTHMHAHARAHARRGTRADHARTCRLRAAHVRTSIRQVVTPWSRPAPARLPPQLRDVHGLHSRLSTDLRRRLERARTRGAFFCSRWGVFVANPSTQCREHERKFRPCHRVEQDGGPGLEGPLPRASRTRPGVRASRPSPPSDLECPPWPAAGGLSRGRHRTSAAGRTAPSRASDLAICEDRGLPAGAALGCEGGRFRASQGGARVRPGRCRRRRGKPEASLVLRRGARRATPAVCSVVQPSAGGQRGGPKHEREAPCSDSEVPADRRLGREGPPPPAVTSGWVCIQCPSPSTPAPYGDAQEPGNGSRGLRPRGRANAHA